MTATDPESRRVEEIIRCATQLDLNITNPEVRAYLTAVTMCRHLRFEQIPQAVNLFFANPGAIFKAALQNADEYRQSQIQFMDYLLTINSADDELYLELNPPAARLDDNET